MVSTFHHDFADSSYCVVSCHLDFRKEQKHSLLKQVSDFGARWHNLFYLEKFLSFEEKDKSFKRYQVKVS